MQKLPPVTFDHVDVTSFLKDIVSLKSAIANVRETYATIDQVNDLRSEVYKLKYASLVNIDDDNVNTRKRGNYLLDSGPSGFLHFSTTTDASIPPENKVCARSPLRSHSGANEESAVSLAPEVPLPAPLVTMEDATSSDEGDESPKRSTGIPIQTINSGLQQQQMSSTQINSDAGNEDNKSLAKIVIQAGKWQTSKDCDSEWIKVQRKKYGNKLEPVRGKASILPNDKIQAADQRTALFISNVHKETSDQDIADYIFSKTNERITLHKIKMKSEKSYQSYKAMVQKNKFEIYLNEKLWPDGITCRRFMPYKKQNERRNLNE